MDELQIQGRVERDREAGVLDGRPGPIRVPRAGRILQFPAGHLSEFRAEPSSESAGMPVTFHVLRRRWQRDDDP